MILSFIPTRFLGHCSTTCNPDYDVYLGGFLGEMIYNNLAIYNGYAGYVWYHAGRFIILAIGVILLVYSFFAYKALNRKPIGKGKKGK